MKLVNKVALVTGASRGIGQAIALALAGEGATVVVNYVHDAGAAQKTTDQVVASGGQAMAWRADVTSPPEVNRMAAAVVEEAGMRPVNLGPETPLAVLQDAAEQQRAALVWLSASTVEGAESTKAALPKIMEALAPLGTHVMIGGRAAHLLDPFGSPQLTLAAHMAELAAFAKGLLSGRSV